MSRAAVWGLPWGRAPPSQGGQEAGDVLRIFDKKQKCHRRAKKKIKKERNKTKPSKGNRSPAGSHENLCLALRNSRKIAGGTKVVFCGGG